ncbi:MAG: NADH-quinone oxidoreductase subunit NuoE [Ignavibacteriales bacterium]|jgi:NADH-quinone oxidoreductase subunit E|nr:NADH-quinone oxidoreductase subunit NuoE [Ignavibacteriaceae bacterium]NLH61809.1 NADH-quinone oxidoreductase subunit NuoE [Ignavibacteriales bacterium]HOJ18189.1 NADH-quinone oxidoreductase subunit NuoE [Ignavibacteriaceae bacterium]HPO55741.1 NADH-quinone oxidoreductase subunit NuoE [Ignavibacteriaceae bacterium]
MHSEIFKNYTQNDKSAIIPLLQDVQQIYGYLPEKVLLEVAKFTGLALSRVYGIATFYNQFRLTPLGENIIRVCRGTACHVKGSANILYTLEQELKIQAGETTRDKKFTLEVVSCIGACSIAPVITVNDDYFGRLTTKEIPGILKKYANKPKAETKKEGSAS